MQDPDLSTLRLCVVGLGYVGLPLAVCFGRRYATVGFDVNRGRVEALRQGKDATGEVTPVELAASSRLVFSADAADIAGANVYIIAVPTPVDEHRRPDFGPLLSASIAVGRALAAGDTVIYESTVYPGATEEVCVPVLERESGLRFNRDFTVGYSPERINPGDHAHRLPSIVKVTSGSTPAAASMIDALYGSVITAGTFRAASIRVAEAAKVIENTQRDVNIALVNELAVLFHKLGLDTGDVLAAAGTKWNFLPFRPGLVGGHCIGVDPYYLTHKAQAVGHHPEIILAGRRLNDSMAAYVASQVLKLMLGKKINPVTARVLVVGLAFKADCPDLRNTKVVDLCRELLEFGCQVQVFDTVVDRQQAEAFYGLDMVEKPAARDYDALVLAVAHASMQAEVEGLLAPAAGDRAVVYDITGTVPRSRADGRL